MCSNFIRTQKEALDIMTAIEHVTDEAAGAIASFMGTTRDTFEGKRVIQLEYEAFIPMAESEMYKICKSIREKWTDVMHIAILHRIGIVPVKEASVFIAVSSPHRAAALEACEYAINTLKATVTIWKKEVYDTHPPLWKANPEWNSDTVTKQ